MGPPDPQAQRAVPRQWVASSEAAMAGWPQRVMAELSLQAAPPPRPGQCPVLRVCKTALGVTAVPPFPHRAVTRAQSRGDSGPGSLPTHSSRPGILTAACGAVIWPQHGEAHSVGARNPQCVDQSPKTRQGGHAAPSSASGEKSVLGEVCLLSRKVLCVHPGGTFPASPPFSSLPAACQAL